MIAKGDSYTLEELLTTKLNIVQKAKDSEVSFFDVFSIIEEIKDENEK